MHNGMEAIHKEMEELRGELTACKATIRNGMFA